MPRTFEWYEEEVAKLNFVKDKKIPLYVYPMMGLCGETGEVAEEIKKGIRETDGTELPDERVDNIFYELGDVLWYLTALAGSFGFTLEDVAEANIKKLTARREKRGR